MSVGTAPVPGAADGAVPREGGAGAELLRVERLSRHFGGFAAVAELSFHVEEGEVLGLVGPNGAGKTTTFNVVTGFLKPTTGRVYFRGEDVTGMPPHALARRGLVRTFQHTRVFSELSVRENVRVASHLREGG
ncbi:MAG TPA: ATP-binding cassette domain-containing protein, partial [Trueperaceae bacterium]|nr:ATP-binding cassette domain-containing protein [Trueperaceae bacterium]